MLRWGNAWGWQEATSRTLEWYARSADGEAPRDLVLEQVAEYVALAGSPQQ